jgi:hypothetical protein
LLRPSDIVLKRSQAIETVICEITLEEYQARQSPWNKQFPYCPNDIVLVKELAFGCFGETSSKVSLWFDLPAPDVLSNQEIKRHKRTRQRQLIDKQVCAPSIFPGTGSLGAKGISFETHGFKPFFHARPINNEKIGFGLIRSILNHRINSLIQRKCVTIFDPKCASNSILNEEKNLQIQFQGLVKDMDKWKWSASTGREHVWTETRILPCNTMYKPSKKGSVTCCLWEGLLKSLSPKEQNNRPRPLSVFNKLARGQSAHDDAMNPNPNILPHIKGLDTGNKPVTNVAWETIIGDKKIGGWVTIQGHYLDAKENKFSKDKNLPLNPSTPGDK